MAQPQAHRGDIIASVGLDARPLQSGLSSAGRSIENFSRQGGQRFSRLTAGVQGLAGVVGGLGTEGAASVSRLGTAFAGITSVLSGGLVAAVGIGIGALATGLVRSVRRAREAREHMAALAKETGVTADQVGRLEEAFASAGKEISRLEAQQIAQIAHEAGVSTGEVERLTSQVIQLATLKGIDVGAAATEVIRIHGEGFAEVEKIAEAAVLELERREAGVSAQMMALSKRSQAAVERHAEAIKERDEAEAEGARQAARAAAARKQAAREEEAVVARMYRSQARNAERAARQSRAIAQARNDEIASLERLMSLAGEGASAISQLERKMEEERKQREKQKEALEAEQRWRARQAAALETQLLAATHARDQEAQSVVRLTQALAALDDRRRAGTISREDARRQAELLTEQHQDAIDLIARRMAEQQADAMLRAQIAEAALTRDLIAQARLRSDAAIEQLRRRHAEEERLAAQTAARLETASEEGRERIERQLEHERAIAAATRREIVAAETAAGQEIQRIRAEVAMQSAAYDRETALMAARAAEDRIEEVRLRAEAELEEVALLEAQKTITVQQAEERRRQIHAATAAEQARIQEREVVQAMQGGQRVGQAMLQGVKSVTESDEWTTVFRSILAVAAAVASIVPGGQVAGAGLGLFAGLFADGGHIRGPGGPRDDRILARVSAGEFIVQASAVRALGLPAMETINQGRLPAFADGGLVGGGVGALAGAGEGARVMHVSISTPGTFLTRELLYGEVLEVIREAAIAQDGTVMRTLPDMRRVGRR